MAAAAVVIVYVISVVLRTQYYVRSLFSQRQQRVTLRTADATARVFAQEENDERKDQTEADRKGERDDGHDAGFTDRKLEALYRGFFRYLPAFGRGRAAVVMTQ